MNFELTVFELSVPDLYHAIRVRQERDRQTDTNRHQTDTEIEERQKKSNRNRLIEGKRNQIEFFFTNESVYHCKNYQGSKPVADQLGRAPHLRNKMFSISCIFLENLSSVGILPRRFESLLQGILDPPLKPMRRERNESPAQKHNINTNNHKQQRSFP